LKDSIKRSIDLIKFIFSGQVSSSLVPLPVIVIGSNIILIITESISSICFNPGIFLVCVCVCVCVRVRVLACVRVCVGGGSDSMSVHKSVSSASTQNCQHSFVGEEPNCSLECLDNLWEAKRLFHC
jgi:hypothetical protein